MHSKHHLGSLFSFLNKPALNEILKKKRIRLIKLNLEADPLKFVQN